MKHIYMLFLCFKIAYGQNNNPDIFANTVEIISAHGYSVESHSVQTKDGFILTVHRIPHGKHSNNTSDRQPVFLMHGVTFSSAHWVLNGNKSLAFTLSDQGYDVWIGNNRGNGYSNRHIKYQSTDFDFWDFSDYEMGIYDIPAVIEYIAEKTQKKGEILYIGHSMGSTLFFIYSSMFSNASDYIKMMIGMAPASWFYDVRSPIRLLAPFTRLFDYFRRSLQINHLSAIPFLQRAAVTGCDITNIATQLCEGFLFSFVGFDYKGFDNHLLPVILSHFPEETSTKTLIQLAQLIRSKKFTPFDYGKSGNLLHYGTDEPPPYNVSNINIPMYLMSGSNDWLVGQQVVEKFISEAKPGMAINYIVPFEKFNHFDFLWHKDVDTLVNERVMEQIKKYSMKKNDQTIS